MLVKPQQLSFTTPLKLDSKKSLSEYSITYEIYGTLSQKKDNAILVCHGLTNNSHAAGKYTLNDSKVGWWDFVIGKKKSIDTNQYCVICTNVLGGSHGSTGPASHNPKTNKPYSITLPILTIGDMVKAQYELMKKLGIEKWKLVIGGCMGGFQALHWGVHYPDNLEKLITLGTTPQASTHTIALFSLFRKSIMRDPLWNQGNYYNKPFPKQGMEWLAHLGFLFWMNKDIMTQKFGRKIKENNDYNYSFKSEFEVEHYLDEAGKSISNTFDPNSLLYLTKAMEYFDLSKGFNSIENAVSNIKAEVHLISFTKDWRYPSTDIEELNKTMLSQGVNTKHQVIETEFGHGAFLYDKKWIEQTSFSLNI